MPCQQPVTPISNGCPPHAQLETGLVRVEVQPSIPSCRCYLSCAEETIYPSIYVDRRIELPVSEMVSDLI